MKKIKLISIITILIFVNIYILISVAFEIKYSNLIEDYNKLSVEYYELYEEYVVQGEKLQAVIALNQEDGNVSLKEYMNKIFNIREIDLGYLAHKIKNIGLRSIFETMNKPIFE